jgi:hypothetical protein
VCNETQIKSVAACATIVSSPPFSSCQVYVLYAESWINPTLHRFQAQEHGSVLEEKQVFIRTKYIAQA